MSDQGLGEASAQERRPQTGTSVSHTPGPWVVGWCVGDGAYMIEPERGGSVICKRGPWTHNVGSSLANAALIAAAPDMLATLRRVVEVARSPSYQIGFAQLLEDAANDAEAAIAKATSPSASIGGE